MTGRARARRRATTGAFVLACASTWFTAPALAAAPQHGSATYEVLFDASWSATTHPGAHPFGAHFSPLIGAVHGDAAQLWELGGIASFGMEAMAEEGETSPLAGEVALLLGAGTASQLVVGSGTAAQGSSTVTLTVTTDHPLVSLMTMAAPSPDWFLGVDGKSLLEGGLWVDDDTVLLYAHDAGTDSGIWFWSPNNDTVPQEPISRSSPVPFFADVPLGTFTFTRQHSTLVFGCGVNPAGSLTVADGVPRLGQTVTLALADPSGTMGTPALPFVGLSTSADPAFPCGTPLPGFGLAAPGAVGELLIGNLARIEVGPLFGGAPVAVPLAIPTDPALVGQRVFAQGLLIDPVAARWGLTDGVELLVGP